MSQTPAGKLPKILEGEDETTAEDNSNGAKPIALQTRSQARTPPSDQPAKGSIAAAWMMTVPILNKPVTPTTSKSATLPQQELEHEQLGHFEVTADEVKRQEEEKRLLKKKLEDWMREQEEEK